MYFKHVFVLIAEQNVNVVSEKKMDNGVHFGFSVPLQCVIDIKYEAYYNKASTRKS